MSNNVESKKIIREAFTGEERVVRALKSLKKKLDALRWDINLTADQVADLILGNPKLMKSTTTSLINSSTFRAKIAQEILTHLLDESGLSEKVDITSIDIEG